MPTNSPATTPAIEPASTANQVRAGEEMRPGPRLLPQVLQLHGALPGLNELLAANASAMMMGRKRVSRYTQLKRQWGERIAWEAKAQHLQPITRAHFAFQWTERDRRRDPDNIAAGGRKLILDGLVKAGILENDGWKQIAGWSDYFFVGTPGVEVFIVEVE